MREVDGDGMAEEDCIFLSVHQTGEWPVYSAN